MEYLNISANDSAKEAVILLSNRRIGKLIYYEQDFQSKQRLTRDEFTYFVSLKDNVSSVTSEDSLFTLYFRPSLIQVSERLVTFAHLSR